MTNIYTPEQMAAADHILAQRAEISRRIFTLSIERSRLAKAPYTFNYHDDPAVDEINESASKDFRISASDLHKFGKEFFRRHGDHTWLDVYMDWGWEDLCNQQGWGNKRIGELKDILDSKGITLKDWVPHRVQSTADNEFRFRGDTI